jgi:hypothetical protein
VTYDRTATTRAPLGPAGGSIAAMGVREVLGVVSTFVFRAPIRPRVDIQEVRA